MNLASSLQYRGHTINLYYDDDAERPDTWENDDIFLVYDHRQFTVKRDGYDPADIWEDYKTRNILDGYWIFPVYAYIHSGISLSLSGGTDRFDTSMKGFIMVKRTKGRSYTRSKAEAIAKLNLETWNQYLAGDVYGYRVEETGDSCWGFYGTESAIQEAKSCVDYQITENRQKHFSKLKQWIRNKVPYMYRNPLTQFSI